MSTYVIVEEPGDWPCHADYLLTARTYLQHGVPTTGGRPRIINLCRNLEHLSAGYYCSLLAQARGHHCLPGLQAISVLQPQQPPAKLWRKVQGWLAQQSEDRIRVRAIFGQCEQSELAGLARYYYGLSQLPLQELTLKRGRHGWSVRQQQSLSPLALSPGEQALMLHHAQALVGTGDEEQAAPLYQLAILVDPDDGRASSDELALARFIKAAAVQGIRAEILPPSAIETAAGVRHPLAACGNGGRPLHLRVCPSRRAAQDAGDRQLPRHPRLQQQALPLRADGAQRRAHATHHGGDPSRPPPGG